MNTTPKTGIPFPTGKQREWNDEFTDTMNSIDSKVYSAQEDRNLLLTEGGTFTFNSTSGLLTWSAAIEIFSPVSGFNISIAAGNVTVANNQVVYVDITRRPTQNLTATFTLASNLSLANGENSLIFGMRKGTTFYTRNGRAISNGESFTLLRTSSSGGGGGSGSLTLTGGQTIQSVASDPTVVGVPAVLGSLAALNGTNKWYFKSGSGDTDWTIFLPPFTISI